MFAKRHFNDKTNVKKIEIGLGIYKWQLLHITASSMEESGALKVDSYLQVEGHEDVFALGDCNNTPENKLGMAAETQAGVLIENMKKKYNQQEMVPYKPGKWNLLYIIYKPTIYIHTWCSYTPHLEMGVGYISLGLNKCYLTIIERSKYFKLSLSGSLPFALVLAFGRNSGLTQFAGGSIMWESLAKKMKASGMQIDMIWKTFNQKPPSD